MKICLDPGHGGSDPGASFLGINEKDAALRTALYVEALFQGTATEVMLTRRTDHFVALETRCAMANEWGADFFVSIHTNADPDQDGPGDPQASGAEALYYTSIAGRKLAEYVSRSFRREFPDEPWRGEKFRSLHVLRNTKMPAVLIETAFIDDSETNRKLRDDAVLRHLAFAIMRAVLAF